MATLANQLNPKPILQFYENVVGIENPLSRRWQLNISKRKQLLQQLFRDSLQHLMRGHIDYHKIIDKPLKRSVKSVKNLMERKPETSVTGMPSALFNILRQKIQY